MSSSAWQVTSGNVSNWRSPDALENLELVENIPIPREEALQQDEVLVRFKAASLNARDMMVVANDPNFPLPTARDLSPGADGAGEVVFAGRSSAFKPGDKVILTAGSWETDAKEVPTIEEFQGRGAGNTEGTLRQYGVLKDSHLRNAPSYLSFEEIASIPTAGGTAMNALCFGPFPLKKGQTIVTQGTGGVSCFTIQIAAALGATIIATSSSDEKLEHAKKLGAHHLINYKKTPDWDQEVIRITNGRGADHVVDVAGAQTVEKSLACAKHGGLVSVIGFLSGPQKVEVVEALIFGAKTLRGVFSIRNDHLEALLELMEEKKIHPKIGKLFEWHQANEAFKQLMDMSNVVGKIAISI